MSIGEVIPRGFYIDGSFRKIVCLVYFSIFNIVSLQLKNLYPFSKTDLAFIFAKVWLSSFTRKAVTFAYHL